MLTIHTDVKQTRRKRFHHVFAEDNETVLFSSRSLMQCIEWTLDQGHQGFMLAGEERCISLVYCDCQM